MNISQIQAMIERTKVLLADARAQAATPTNRDTPPSELAARLATIDAQLAELEVAQGELIGGYEASLRERDALVRRVTAAAPVILTVVDAAGIITHYEGAGVQAFGMRSGQVVGMSAFEAFPDNQEGLTFLRRALAGESLRWLGTYRGRTFEAFYTPLHDPHGAVEQVIVVSYDVTDRLSAEQDLRSRTFLLQQILAHAPVVLTNIDRQGVYTLIVGAATEALGFTPDLIGQSIFTLLADQPEVLERFQRALAGETVRWTGSYLNNTVDSVLTPARDQAGAVVSVIGIALDQTPRAQAEAELRERDALVRQIVDHAPMILFALDRQGRITFTDGKGLALIGERPGETVGQSIFDVRARDQVELAAVRRALGGESTAWVSSEPPYFDSRVSPLYDAHSQVAGAIGVGIDITDRMLAEQRLRDVEQRLRELIEHAPIVLFAADRDGTITLSEGRGLLLLGEIAGETVGQNIFDLWAPQPAAVEHLRRAFAGEEVAWVSDSLPHFDSRLVPIVDAAGQVTGVLGIGVDVTDRARVEAERRELDRRLLEAQKLESLGMLAGGIAHDFNNLLQSILGNVESVLDERAPPEPVREALDRVRTITRRGADLTRQLLAYAGLGRFAVEVLDLNMLVRESMAIIAVSAPKTITLTVQLDDQALAIEGDATQVQQILINLVMNAADAIDGEGGTITVSTGRQALMAADIASLTAQPAALPPPAAGEYAALTVADTGLGMDEPTLARVFEPFFTTKTSGRGLGLAAVQGILRGHAGGIRVTSALGQGTVFTVYLPITTKPFPAPPPTPPAQPAQAWVGSGTVLVVDDDPSVRDVAARNLRRLGFTTMSASNGLAALEVFETHRDEITCVLIDHAMPKMDGVTAARRLRALVSDLCIVMMTGYNEQDVVDNLEPGLMNAVLFKPFTVEQLRDVLSARG